MPPTRGGWQGDTPFILPVFQHPRIVPADEANLPDDAEVIGVRGDGWSRAYAVSALSRVQSHVVNDLIGDTPLTIAFCDRTKNVRCLSSELQGQPLAVRLGGWKDGQMLLMLDHRFYAHLSEDLPCTDVLFEQTTWKAWREAQPETDVYVEAPSEL